MGKKSLIFCIKKHNIAYIMLIKQHENKLKATETEFRL